MASTLTNEEVYSRAEKKVKQIISINIKDKALQGFLNLDIKVNKPTDVDDINKFLGMCQSIFQDLEYTCYVDYDTHMLNLAWDKINYDNDKRDMVNNKILYFKDDTLKNYHQLLNNPIIIKSDTTSSNILLFGYDNYNDPIYYIENNDILSTYINPDDLVSNISGEYVYIPYVSGFTNQHTIDRNNYLNVIGDINQDVTTKNYPVVVGTAIITGSTILSGVESISSMVSGYPHYIMETKTDLTEYLSNEVSIKQYIPYNIDYLSDQKYYKFIPSGTNTTITATLTYDEQNNERISCDNPDINNMLLTEYNTKLNDAYNTIMSNLNDEYNRLSGNTKDENRQRKLISNQLLINIPKQYNNAKLKLIQNNIQLSGDLPAITNGINVYFTADKIESYVPTGYVEDMTTSPFVSGGEVSTTITWEDYIDIPQNKIINKTFTVNWDEEYLNPIINYIEPINILNYQLQSALVDPMYDYYAKYYHELAVGVLTGGCLDDPLLSADTITNDDNGFIRAKDNSTYPLYFWFANNLSGRINEALKTNRKKDFNLYSDLNGLYSMADETETEKYKCTFYPTDYYTSRYGVSYLYCWGSDCNPYTYIAKSGGRSYNKENLYIYKVINPYKTSNSTYNNLYTNTAQEFNASECFTSLSAYTLDESGNKILNGNINDIIKYMGPTIVISDRDTTHHEYKHDTIFKFGVQNYTYQLSGWYDDDTGKLIDAFWVTPAPGLSLTNGDYKICALKNEQGGKQYNYVEYKLMKNINYKSALIILQFLCKQQKWKMTFNYFNQYYYHYIKEKIESKWHYTDSYCMVAKERTFDPLQTFYGGYVSSSYTQDDDNYKVDNLYKKTDQTKMYSIIKIEEEKRPSQTSEAQPTLRYQSSFDDTVHSSVVAPKEVIDVAHIKDFSIEIKKAQ